MTQQEQIRAYAKEIETPAHFAQLMAQVPDDPPGMRQAVRESLEPLLRFDPVTGDPRPDADQ